MPNLKYAFIGNGGMSCATAVSHAHMANKITIWGHNPDSVQACNTLRENKVYLPEIILPSNIYFTTNVTFLENFSYDLVLVGVPTQHIRSTLTNIHPPQKGTVVVSLSKGLELQTFKRPTEIIKEIWPETTILALSGPAQAEELARFKPCTLVLASPSEEEAVTIQTSLNTNTFRVYHSSDVVGVEIAGALKNIIGIAAGICDGLQFGDNAKSAIMTRGCAEIARLGVNMGAKLETFFGLAGMGDIITTCISPYGRNYSLGIKIGQGKTLEEILLNTKKVSEGVPTVQAIQKFSKKLGIELPIANEVYAVLFENKNPLDGVKSLMERTPKSEF